MYQVFSNQRFHMLVLYLGILAYYHQYLWEVCASKNNYPPILYSLQLIYFTNSNIKPGNALDNSFRTQTVEAARADAERVRLIGASEARAIEAVGRAEAEKMRMKASAYKQYGDAAIMALVLEALPQIAAEVAAPLAKTDEIVLLGGADKTTTEVNKLLGQLPPAISALTGVDVTGALGKIPGATMKVA